MIKFFAIISFLIAFPSFGKHISITPPTLEELKSKYLVLDDSNKIKEINTKNYYGEIIGKQVEYKDRIVSYSYIYDEKAKSYTQKVGYTEVFYKKNQKLVTYSLYKENFDLKVFHENLLIHDYEYRKNHIKYYQKYKINTYKYPNGEIDRHNHKILSQYYSEDGKLKREIINKYDDESMLVESKVFYKGKLEKQIQYIHQDSGLVKLITTHYLPTKKITKDECEYSPYQAQVNCQKYKYGGKKSWLDKIFELHPVRSSGTP